MRFYGQGGIRMIKVAFLCCCFMVVYPYVVYPVLLKLLSFFRHMPILIKESTPRVTVIISAFNEEDVIAKKIENTLALDYPKENLEIIVVSDNSTDRTDEIVKRYESRGVILLSQPVRRGKTAGLNDAVRNARGKILVFSDADSMYESNALKIISGAVASDRRIGLVTGSTNYVSEGQGKMVVTTGIYARLERFIKKHESLVGSCVGADGAIFGMRKSLYKPLQDDDINDLVLPLKVVKQGRRVVLLEQLTCTEAPAADESGEFKRQVRITNRTLRALFRHAELMNVIKFPLFSFEVVSHKMLKLSAPFFMLSLLPLNFLLLDQGRGYYAFFIAQVACYGLCLLRLLRDRGGKKHALFGFIYHFIMVNVSILVGWIKFVTGKKSVVWNPQRQ
jgi:cellulose synthase/poly-beta-1,6-N-acetylglucosamine synthase-like glycosyltransferase